MERRPSTAALSAGVASLSGREGGHAWDAGSAQPARREYISPDPVRQEGDLNAAHVRRLLQLELVEWTGATWRLTEMGRQRLDTLGANPSD
jgi:hypothetical protein